MFTQLSKPVRKKDKETNKRINKSVDDLLLGNQSDIQKQNGENLLRLYNLVLISEDDVTETAQDLQAAPDPGYHHEVNVIIVFLEHCMSFW